MTFREWHERRMRTEEGFGPYIGPCIDTPNYQVMGACSDYNTDSKNRSVRRGEYAHALRKPSVHKKKNPLS